MICKWSPGPARPIGGRSESAEGHPAFQRRACGTRNLFGSRAFASFGYYGSSSNGIVVIADRLSWVVRVIFADPAGHSGSELAMGAVWFGIQLYADFSGYSDMAIGCARLLGIRVTKNFAGPYFSRDTGVFWRRWHISLSTWFRDYVYTPLSWKTPLTARGQKFACILGTFTASGLWHGASWNFVLWGLIHGLLFAPLILGWISPYTEEGSASLSRPWLAGLKHVVLSIGTFAGVSFAWILFRASTVSHAAQYMTRMFTTTWLPLPRYRQAILVAVIFMAIEWLRHRHEHPIADLSLPTPARWLIYGAVALGLILLSGQGPSQFLYARF